MGRHAAHGHRPHYIRSHHRGSRHNECYGGEYNPDGYYGGEYNPDGYYGGDYNENCYSRRRCYPVRRCTRKIAPDSALLNPVFWTPDCAPRIRVC